MVAGDSVYVIFFFKKKFVLGVRVCLSTCVTVCEWCAPLFMHRDNIFYPSSDFPIRSLEARSLPECDAHVCLTRLEASESQ